MSYVKKRLGELKNRACQNCGGEVGEGSRADKLFCSDDCRVKAHAKTVTNLRPAAKDSQVVNLTDLQWRRRVRCGDVTPLHGEACYACGKLMKRVSDLPSKQMFCSDKCMRDGEGQGLTFIRFHATTTALRRDLMLPKAQLSLKRFAQAQALLDEHKRCDWCERKVRFKHCGQKQEGDEQPAGWVGSYKPQYLFCAPLCRQLFYRQFRHMSYPPEPINSVVVLKGPVARIVSDALGQGNPLGRPQINSVARVLAPFPSKRVRQDATGKGVVLYHSYNFVTVPIKYCKRKGVQQFKRLRFRLAT